MWGLGGGGWGVGVPDGKVSIEFEEGDRYRVCKEISNCGAVADGGSCTRCSAAPNSVLFRNATCARVRPRLRLRYRHCCTHHQIIKCQWPPAVVRAVEPKERLVTPIRLPPHASTTHCAPNPKAGTKHLEQALPVMQRHDFIQSAVCEYCRLLRPGAARQRVHVPDVNVRGSWL